MLISALITVAAMAMQGDSRASAQTAPPQPSATAPQQHPSPDIVIEGLRDLDEAESIVTPRSFSSARLGPGQSSSRAAFNPAKRFAHCVINKASPATLERLSAVLDQRTNSTAQGEAQRRLTLRNAACGEDPEAILSRGANASLHAFFDTSYYDRGALYLEAVRAFSKPQDLTTTQTEDPAVQARFETRERTLARFRLPQDRTYFQVAICLVRGQPALASKLVRADDADAVRRSEAALVNRERSCVGNARHVYFDPSQMQFYIAEALYRWLVAARGLDSLVPES